MSIEKTILNERTKPGLKKEIDFLIKMKFDFSVLLSNYTTTIKSPAFNKMYMLKRGSQKMFIAYKMILRDIKEKNIPAPKIDRSRCRYFSHRKGLESGKFNKVVNIDLKSAYATILFNEGIISQKTFDYLQTLPKEDRLAAVGMLAKTKTEFVYKAGELTEHPLRHREETEGFFFYAVNRTRGIMENIENLLNNDFIFSWVDGIYFSDESKAGPILEYLKEININYSLQYCTNFEIIEKKELYFINFVDEKGRKKPFNVPKTPPSLKTIILQYLNLI